MSSRFLTELDRRILVLDGAMGTQVHELDLDLDTDYLGKENCTEVLVLTRPDAIQSIHETYFAAGSDAVETDTFGAMPHVLCEFDLQDRAREINRKAVECARAAAENYSTDDKPRFVVGSMGPGTKLITLGQIDWPTMYASYSEAAHGLIEGGSDVLLLETCQDILMIKVALNAILDKMHELGVTTDDIPIMTQVTIEQTGTMLTGTDIAAAAIALREYPILSMGMNCATGPTDMAEHVAWLGKHWTKRISLLPNAGLPTLVEGRTEYPLGAEPFAEQMLKFVREQGLSIVGGCCGTTPGHITALANAVDGMAPLAVDKDPAPPSCTSLYVPTPYRQDTSILNIGERCNSSGSRAFKRLLEAEDWDEMVSLARQQVREGSHVLDVNVDYAGRDSEKDMAEVVSRFVRQVDAPLMLDSTQPSIIEAGLRHAPGKCIINSANLEDGEEKFAELCELARKYDAGLVMGTIDEDPEEAMARTEERKIEIAQRMFELATEKYGLAAGDIMFDPLVLPISTGMDKDRRSGLETIAGVKRIATELPECQITVGLSNISFGLKPAARQVLNSVFLAELIEAGLTSAIVHISKILPRTKIAPELWDAAVELIYNRSPEEDVVLSDGTPTRDPLQIFIDLFPDDASEVTTKVDLAELPLEERLQKHIIDGEKKALTETLDEAMGKYPPLDIVNDHLLAGMKIVGELFGSGQMQLPFVLQSAEVMKMAVAHLEPHMERSDAGGKGKIILATVKGDVHDIGKNLVDIILSNNGYDVVNLGIKQPINAIVDAYEEHGGDAIGLSGLLVKSVNVMEDNLKELNARGIDVPMLLGGAALSKHYCDSYLRTVYDGSTYHGKDAFEGLRIMDHLVGGRLSEIDTEIDARLEKRAQTDEKLAAMEASKASVAVDTLPARSAVATDIAVPTIPFLGDRIVESLNLDDVYPFINRVALYRGQWQFKKGKMSQAEYDAMIEDTVDPVFDRLAAYCRDENVLDPKVVYGYYKCQSDGENLIVYDPQDDTREIERFSFPRQAGKKRLCISDYFRSVESGEHDVIGLSCVTMGQQVSTEANKLFENDDYTEYLYLHGFGVECAEALAELWHKRMRQELGISGDDAGDPRKLFTQRYRGSRYSFGYPACPEMSDQDKLFRLLKPDRIGCVLTDNWQIDPEQSTSAIIVHHPEAKYFNV